MSNKSDEYPTEDLQERNDEPQSDLAAEQNDNSISETASTEGGNYVADDGSENGSCSPSEQEERDAAKAAAGVDFRASPKEASGTYMMVAFIIFSFVSFAFMLTASTTVPWMAATNGDNWTLWKDVTGIEWRRNPCQHKAQMFQAMQAFSVTSCALSLGCLIAGILQVCGIGHMGVSIALSFVTMGCELTAWSLIVHQYHKYNCPGELPYVNNINRLQAGFVLTFISFSFMLFGCGALVYYLWNNFAYIPETKKMMSNTALFAACTIGSCCLITCVGSAFTLWEDYSVDFKIKVTLWHIEILYASSGLSEYWSYTSYGCSSLNSMFRVGQAFAIISSLFLFIATLFCVGAVFSRVCKWITVAFSAASWVFLLICWAVCIGIRYRVFCPEGTPDTHFLGLNAVPLGEGTQVVSFKGFVITEGLGMIISAWCAMTIMIIFVAIKV